MLTQNTPKSSTSALLIMDQRRPCNQGVIHVGFALIHVKHLVHVEHTYMTLWDGEKKKSSSIQH